MSGKVNYMVILLIIIMLFFASSCANLQQDLVLALMEPGAGAVDSSYTTHFCQLEYIFSESQMPASITYASYDVFSGPEAGWVGSITAGLGQYVRVGDILAEVVYDIEILIENRQRLSMLIDRDEYNLAIDIARRQSAIDGMLASLASLSGTDAIIANLRLEKAMYELGHFIEGAQGVIDGYYDEIEIIDDKIGGYTVFAEEDGYITDIARLFRGDAVAANTRLMTIEKRDDFVIRLDVGSAAGVNYEPIFRFNNMLSLIVQTTPNPTHYSAIIATDPFAANPEATNMRYRVNLMGGAGVLADDTNYRVFIRARHSEVYNVPALPRRFVYSENDQSFVYLLEDNVKRKRYVQTGMENNEFIEIISGVKPGDTVTY